MLHVSAFKGLEVTRKHDIKLLSIWEYVRKAHSKLIFQSTNNSIYSWVSWDLGANKGKKFTSPGAKLMRGMREHGPQSEVLKASLQSKSAHHWAPLDTQEERLTILSLLTSACFKKPAKYWSAVQGHCFHTGAEIGMLIQSSWFWEADCTAITTHPGVVGRDERLVIKGSEGIECVVRWIVLMNWGQRKEDPITYIKQNVHYKEQSCLRC